jgi:hypothetical protein
MAGRFYSACSVSRQAHAAGRGIIALPRRRCVGLRPLREILLNHEWPTVAVLARALQRRMS